MNQLVISAILLGWILAVPAHAAGVRFLAPQDGAEVKGPVKVRMAVEGMRVTPAGNLVPDTGHFHILVDEDPMPKGQTIPKDARHIHFGKGQTEAEIRLAPGMHRLTLQFADGLHRSYGRDWAQTITIYVQKPHHP